MLCNGQLWVLAQGWWQDPKPLVWGPQPAAAAACAPITWLGPQQSRGDQVSHSPHHSTHLSAGRISEFWPGSCFPNWLEGKPRTTIPWFLSSSCSAFSSACKESQGWVSRGPGTPPHLHLSPGTIPVRPGLSEQALTLSPAPQSRMDHADVPKAALLGPALTPRCPCPAGPLPTYCRVRPQYVATLTKSTVFPLYLSKGMYSSPSRVRAP